MLPVLGGDCEDAMVRRGVAALVLAASLLAAGAMPAHADERLFGFLSTTDTMPHGKWEQQDFLTARLGKSRGDYQLYELQNGVDYGVTDAFQAALYLDSHIVTAERDSPAGRTSGAFVPRDVDPSRRYTSAALDGVTLNA